VAELKAEDIFAKEVHSSGFAFHSKYIADAAPKLKASLDKVPRHSLNEYFAKNFPCLLIYISAAYHKPETSLSSLGEQLST